MVTLSAVVCIRYLIKGAGRVTIMIVGNCGGYAPTPYNLWGQLPPLLPQFRRYEYMYIGTTHVRMGGAIHKMDLYTVNSGY